MDRRDVLVERGWSACGLERLDQEGVLGLGAKDGVVFEVHGARVHAAGEELLEDDFGHVLVAQL